MPCLPAPVVRVAASHSSVTTGATFLACCVALEPWQLVHGAPAVRTERAPRLHEQLAFGVLSAAYWAAGACAVGVGGGAARRAGSLGGVPPVLLEGGDQLPHMLAALLLLERCAWHALAGHEAVAHGLGRLVPLGQLAPPWKAGCWPLEVCRGGLQLAVLKLTRTPDELSPAALPLPFGVRLWLELGPRAGPL
ncbi:DNA internalization-related competence Rec2 [Micractinium conductrix]|uniref:DNA internalization-related competence Rec2 n=1 Tax=Micractinium conductrix TaxID=554055 RepID=A0A2P6VGA9_9CHLO|nr:DNA internalization-related competence Rec2 [Micractinium conductrix]|eukprot:PSC73126.1 DNA internalization-related competence Rec2 [Micractinium conductrix]